MPIAEVLPGLYIKSGHISDNEIPPNWARLSIREEGPPSHPGDLLHINLPDDVPWPPDVVSGIVDFIDSHLREGVSVLVECVAGVSRSPSAVLAYIMHRDSLAIEQALERLRSTYSPADPSARILDSLEEYFRVRG